MLSGSPAPTDYVLSGFSWSDPGRITYSVPPDGINWDGGANDINASLGAQLPDGSWLRDVARALQTWASVANINVVPVADGGEDFNANGRTQGDPRFGDIRVGGYDFDSGTILAQSYNPPPNGLTEAGDVEVNTGFDWGPGAAYDLYSVLLHETGLALGLGETTDPSAVMNRIYGGVRPGLEPVDIAGIQAIYGPRRPDPLQALGQATSAASAFDLTSLLAPVGGGRAQATVGGLSLDAVGDTEYFSVVAPAGSGPETLLALANPEGISSLSPRVTIYDASMHALASVGDGSLWGDGAPALAGGIQPGHRYIVAVTGATGDAFSVGAYNFQITFGGIANGGPTVPPTPVSPPTPVPPPPVLGPPTTAGSPSPTAANPPTTPHQAPPIARDRFEPDNTAEQAVDLGVVRARVVTGLTIYASYDNQTFTFIPAAAGTVVASTGTTKLWVVDASGRTVASGSGQVSFTNPAPGSRYWVALSSIDGDVNPGFALAIAVVPGASASQQVVARPALDPGWSVPIPSPTPPPTFADAASTARGTAAVVPGRPLQRVAVVNPRWARLG